jgi:tRNA pseudouridine55 synthase
MKRRLDGVLLLDKPSGVSSNAALQIARRRFGALKAGHGGTLDPMASGLLPVLFGEATKFSAWMLEAGKTYRATFTLGIRTDTADAEGKVLIERPVKVDDALLVDALNRFLGDTLQVPPMHSALKRDGTPLYTLARKGIEVPRAARTIRIQHMKLLRRLGPALEIEVACSKGTYIRTIADDLGERLGCGAHLSALCRTRVGTFSLSAARTLESLELQGDTALDDILLPVDRLLEGLAEVRLEPDLSTRFSMGQSVTTAPNGTGLRRVYGVSGRFLGLGELAECGVIRPRRLVANAVQPADNH